MKLATKLELLPKKHDFLLIVLPLFTKNTTDDEYIKLR